MNYMDSINISGLKKEAKCVLDALLMTPANGIGYIEVERRLCSILTLISDYDVSFEVSETIVNGVCKGYCINIYECDGEDIFCDFGNINSLEDFLCKAVTFLDAQIRDNYLSDLSYEIKHTDNVSNCEDISNILDNIAIINDYNNVKKALQEVLDTLTVTNA